MLAMIAGWQSHIALLQDIRRDNEQFYQEALRSENWELFAHNLYTKISQATAILPHMDIFTAEKVHFKNNASRNNYQQRRAAKARGKPGEGERYAPDSIIPNQDFGAIAPQPVQFKKSPMADAANSSDVELINRLIKKVKHEIAPPDPDRLAEALKDAKPEDLF